MTPRLDPTQRRAAIDRLAEDDLDVLVVGGGAVGAGVALDAVSRGLRVGLVERDDWGSGGSGHTSMLVNGSWRDVVDPDPVELRIALRERAMLLGWLAPHLVHRVPFLYPLHAGPGQRLAVGAEVLLYDAIARSATAGRALPAHRHLTRRAVRRLVPALRGDRVSGGVQFYDAQVDDARLVLTVVRTAAAYGAAVANRVEVTGLLRDAGRVRGVRLTDRRTGSELQVRARVVVLAVGAASAARLSGDRAPESVAPARRRVHLVVPRSAIRSSTGIVVPGTGRGLIRIVPWGRHWLIGPGRTGSDPDLGDRDQPAGAGDVDGLLAVVNPHLAAPLRPDQVQACYTGPVSDRVRARHPVRPAPGLVRAGTARLSTYRRVAAETVDAAVAELGGLVADSITERLPLLGADGYHARWNQRHLLARRAGLHVARVEHLLNRYGSTADELLQLVTATPSLGRPLPGAEDYLQAEIGYAVSHEGATELLDILTRRTRIALDTADGGRRAAPAAAALASVELGWDDNERDRQLQTYLGWLATERRALAVDRPG